ncbi:hypothetical protein FGO68_gene3446 [Halteria grandinella]|uniref:Uncharacterized protein n=1 Tax=Halteria grandinella TaxID=5974 RepID=A0A8J8NG14_HALGN|nr:hypothetical protein FGO68_gene3446 [Halteria grandinella]
MAILHPTNHHLNRLATGSAEGGGDGRLSTDQGHFSSTQLLQYTTQQHNQQHYREQQQLQPELQIIQNRSGGGGPVGMRSPTSSGRSVAFSNLPNNKQLLLNNHTSGSKEMPPPPSDLNNVRPNTENNSHLVAKGLLDSRKTARQNVSYYFSNNDQKLIPQRRTNYLIGAQSTSLPLVQQQQQSTQNILSGNANNALLQQRQGVNTAKQTQMRGTLEYNQQRLMMVRRKTANNNNNSSMLSSMAFDKPNKTDRKVSKAPPQTAPNSRQPWELPVSLPLRGRPVTISDRTRELFGRCDAMKQNFQTQIQQAYYQQLQQQQQQHMRQVVTQPAFNVKQPLATKTYEFQPEGNGMGERVPSRLAKAKVLDALPTSNIAALNPTTLTGETQNTHRRSLDNLLRFLDITNNGLNTQQTLANEELPVKHAGPKVIDINQATEIPQAVLEKRQNKNDFYRYLLMQNTQTIEQQPQYRVNNDILIPRSILKRCDKRASNNHPQQNNGSDNEETMEESAVQGVKLKRTNPLLSPKFNQFLKDQAKEELEHMQRQMLLQEQIAKLQQLQAHQQALLRQQKEHEEQLQRQKEAEQQEIQQKQAQDEEDELLKSMPKIKEEETPTAEVMNKDIEQHIEQSSQKKKTMIVKHREAIGGGGFFETQVEVIEKEEVIELNDDDPAPNDAKPIKDDRIFGFTNFNDFRSKYFTGHEVDPLSNLSRIQSIKHARAKYSKRQQVPVQQNVPILHVQAAFMQQRREQQREQEGEIVA